MRYVITVVCSIVLVSSLVMCGSKKMQHKSSFSNFEITTSYHRPLYFRVALGKLLPVG